MATAIFKTKELALAAQSQFHGRILDERELVMEVKGHWKVKKNKPKSKAIKGGNIESRLGAKQDVFSRLAPKLEDRLGKRIDDRLGQFATKPSKKKNKAPKNDRKIKEYADLE